MAKGSKRIENSYNSYLRQRAEWHAKGYGLDRELTLDEYKEVHEAFVHRGEQHPARKIASDERTFSYAEGRSIVRRLKTADQYDDVDKDELQALINRLRKPAKDDPSKLSPLTYKDIIGLELTPEELEAQEQRRRQYYIDRGVTPTRTIQANARADLFNQLRDAGLSYKEADEVLYG